MKVSVIVPVYNAEKYLPACLESILNQTFTDFELLVVDDCSTDSSYEIVESYLERFGGRLKIISLPENTGSGAVPRNVGLDLSQGKYVYFMDADDFLLDTALETLFAYAENYQTDVVWMENSFTCGAEPLPRSSVNEISLIPQKFNIAEPTLETNDIAERVKNFLQYKFGVMPWLKFIRRDLLVDNEIKFPAMRISEDLLWSFKIICPAKKILRIPMKLYFYRKAENSMMGRKRTPQEKVKFWLSPLITGIDCLNEFMNGFDLFNRSDNMRLYVLNFFTNIQIDFMADAFKSLDRHEVYKIYFEEFSKSKSDHTALIAYLLLMKNMYRGDQRK